VTRAPSWPKHTSPDPSLAIYDEEAKSPPAVINPRMLDRTKPRWGDEAIDAILTRLEEMESGRSALGQRLWAEINAVVEEYGNDDDNTVVTTQPDAQGYVTITSVVATVPSGATGVLQLGARVFYLGAGVTNLMGLACQLSQSDLRQLTVSVAGPVSLYLAGHVSPMQGQLPV
jgi:hypothetical protein